MAVLRTGQGVKIVPRTRLRVLEIETRYVHGLMHKAITGLDSLPDAKVIRFPIERRMASMGDAS